MISNKRQEKKITFLKIKIVLSIIISVIFIIFISATYMYYSNIKKEDENQIKQLNKYISNLKNRTRDFEAKISDIQKYKESWEKSDEKKKNFSGINIDEVNLSFTELSELYNIEKPTIKVSVPEVLKGGIYERQVSDVILSNVKISFNSLDDIRSVFFIKDFINSLPGYIIITHLDIKKGREYNDSDLISINLGKMTGIVKVSLEFSWYVFKRKSN